MAGSSPGTGARSSDRRRKSALRRWPRCRGPELNRAVCARAGWRETSVKLRGQINAARVWQFLRSPKNGQRALAAAAKRRVKVIVEAGDRSRVILRAARKR